MGGMTPPDQGGVVASGRGVQISRCLVHDLWWDGGKDHQCVLSNEGIDLVGQSEERVELEGS